MKIVFIKSFENFLESSIAENDFSNIAGKTLF